MSPLKTALAAGAAFVAGWGLHEGLARLPERYEATTPSPVQAAQSSTRSAQEKAAKEAAVKASGGIVTDDGYIVPLNVRDPSALVMGPAPAACPSVPCDCTGEKLKKTGRQAPERF